MATWQEFSGYAGRLGGTRVSDTAWSFQLPGRGESRTQKVYVFYELMKPDVEFLMVKSAFAFIKEVDVERVLKNFGQLLTGAIGYSPLFDDAGEAIDGFLTISTSIPLAVLDLSSPGMLFLYLNLLAQTADDLERKLSLSGNALDAF